MAPEAKSEATFAQAGGPEHGVVSLIDWNLGCTVMISTAGFLLFL